MQNHTHDPDIGKDTDVEHRSRKEPPHPDQQYDPMQAARSQSGRFNRAWLKNGESLNLVQRSGYTILSLLFVGFGLYGLVACADSLRDEAWAFVLIFGVSTLFCLVVGIGGLRNVLRFSPDRKKSRR